VLNGITTDGEGYPETVGRICTVTGRAESLPEKYRFTLFTNIPSGLVFLSTKKVCESGSLQWVFSTESMSRLNGSLATDSLAGVWRRSSGGRVEYDPDTR
jgi:hypothetical protein